MFAFVGEITAALDSCIKSFDQFVDRLNCRQTLWSRLLSNILKSRKHLGRKLQGVEIAQLRAEPHRPLRCCPCAVDQEYRRPLLGVRKHTELLVGRSVDIQGLAIWIQNQTLPHRISQQPGNSGVVVEDLPFKQKRVLQQAMCHSPSCDSPAIFARMDEDHKVATRIKGHHKFAVTTARRLSALPTHRSLLYRVFHFIHLNHTPGRLNLNYFKIVDLNNLKFLRFHHASEPNQPLSPYDSRVPLLQGDPVSA